MCVDDEYRIRVSEHEFWLISPSDNMTRIEHVAPNNYKRLQQLIELCNCYVPTMKQTIQQSIGITNNLVCTHTSIYNRLWIIILNCAMHLVLELYRQFMINLLIDLLLIYRLHIH